MKLRIITCGRPASWAHDAIDHWYKLCKTLADIELISVKEKPQKTLSQRIFRACTGKVVALTRHGSALSSQQWAKMLGDIALEGKAVTFVVGCAEGLPEDVLKGADLLVSFGPVTLQHDVALIVLLEQIYRGLSIIRGMPYHRGNIFNN